MNKRRFGLLLTFTLLLCTTGCRSTYYAAWEKLGKQKRDLLRDQVQKARNDQQAASQQFKDALTRLKELYQFEGGDLEKFYSRLKRDFERSEQKAQTVRDRIDRVEQIASDLFKEWEAELKSIANERLRSDSRQKLNDTRRKFEALSTSMRRAESSMTPVLTQLRDQVLYLKHNLNAAAIGALKGEAVEISQEIERLVQELNRSIAEADAFISALPE
jgi:IS1 family transposase